jgi:hypothetical protein
MVATLFSSFLPGEAFSTLDLYIVLELSTAPDISTVLDLTIPLDLSTAEEPSTTLGGWLGSLDLHASLSPSICGNIFQLLLGLGVRWLGPYDLMAPIPPLPTI